MGTGTIWVSFRSVSVVCWLIGDLTIWFVGCRVIDLELLGDLTFWFVCGCDSHPVFLYPLKKGLLLVIGLRGTLTNLL